LERRDMVSLVIALLAAPLAALAGSGPVQTGADVLVSERLGELAGKRVGLVCNQTSMLTDGRHLADALHGSPGVSLVALFGPEHGIRGDQEGSVLDGVDRSTGVPVYSLYGTSYAPSPDLLASLDLLLFDIQDVGARFYTYISTLGHVMSAAAKAGVPVIVLDRPNPIRGILVEGPVRLDSLASFVGYAPIPVTHGMTIGELAEMYNGEGYLDGGARANLSVIRMKGWTRGRWFDETGLRWVKPSPNIASVRTAAVYPGACFVEGTNMSEGRGTDRPFEVIGAPWVDTARVLSKLRGLKLEGVEFTGVVFVPSRNQTGAVPKHDGSECRGVCLTVTDRDSFLPVSAGVAVLWAFRASHPEEFRWKPSSIDRLVGTPAVREMLDAGRDPAAIVRTWAEQVGRFRTVRAKYLLYE
jgi:uncharacterized protein YbbC (DUF1343 family)